MEERLIAKRPILLDGRLYRAGEALPDSESNRARWIPPGDAEVEAGSPARKSEGEDCDGFQGTGQE